MGRFAVIGGNKGFIMIQTIEMRARGVNLSAGGWKLIARKFDSGGGFTGVCGAGDGGGSREVEAFLKWIALGIVPGKHFIQQESDHNGPLEKAAVNRRRSFSSQESTSLE